MVSASAIGWYKQNLPGPAIETDPPDPGFLGETCKAWENSILPVTTLGKRLVILRTGIVLSNDGGAFPEFAKPVRYGIAGILGSGKQIISWIHIEDICRLYMEAMLNTTLVRRLQCSSTESCKQQNLYTGTREKNEGKFFYPDAGSKLYTPNDAWRTERRSPEKQQHQRK